MISDPRGCHTVLKDGMYNIYERNVIARLREVFIPHVDVMNKVQRG